MQKKEKISIAVRTGGHQYSGFSSTSKNNIQLDLSEAFKCFNYDIKNNLLKVGVSYSLLDFDKKMEKYGLFLPHGICGYLYVGGHVQTGGYGLWINSFSIMSDNIYSFEIIKADSQKEIVTKKSNPDLYFAILGCNPGCYGILTNITFIPFHDKNYPYSCGLYAITLYNKDIFNKLIKFVVNMEKKS